MSLINVSNGALRTLEIQQAETSTKIEEAKLSAMQKLLEPITEAIEELADVIQEGQKKTEKPNDFNKNLLQSIDKVFGVIQNFKQSEIDLSPLTSIAEEIRNQNNTLLSVVEGLAESSNKEGHEKLMKEVMAMVQKTNEFVSNGIKQTDYSTEIKSISSTIESNKPTEWNFKITRGQGNIIESVTAIPKFKK